MKRFFMLAVATMLAVSARADEGMWLLPLLQKMNKSALKEAGCHLSPAEIYSAGKTSLKDAIVHFGGGCTGEIISDEGLVVTNHHCGYSHIQALSTPEHNYLMDGFWAMTRAEEIPCKGLTVTFLQSMEDVTATLEKAGKKAGKDARESREEGREGRLRRGEGQGGSGTEAGAYRCGEEGESGLRGRDRPLL